MNKNFYPKFFYSCLIACCLALPSYSYAAGKDKDPKDKAVYAQLSSKETQIPGIATETVSLEITDQLAGLKVSSSRKDIIIKESGLYFISANGRIGSQSLTLRGSVQLFLKKNGEAIPSTFTSHTPSNNQITANAVSQTVIALKAGDSISVGISSTAPNLGLLSSTVNPNTVIPSISFTIYKFSN